ncbi:MAG TPA: hypothetical protein P5526_24335 [Anaerolineae bacterium]|nr:hypothetical protein [Anaerolineae bacterium]
MYSISINSILIAETSSDHFPDRFATRQAALSRVGELSLKYSR